MPDKTVFNAAQTQPAATPVINKVLIDLNKIMQQCLLPFGAINQDARPVVRCSNLPEVEADEPVFVQLFDLLIKTILNHPPPGRRLFLHIDCERVKKMPADLSVIEISFYTNVIVTDAWIEKIPTAPVSLSAGACPEQCFAENKFAPGTCLPLQRKPVNNHLKKAMPSTLPSVKILIIDDDEDDFFITSQYLKEINEYQLEVDWCFKFSDAVEQLRTRKYQIYFVDYRLGARTGLDFLREAVQLKVEEPIVLLTGKGSKNVDIEAMQMGATDYLVKTELNADKLERCIRYSLERTAYLKALRANEKKYRGIFELSKDAVFIADKTLRFTDMNRATSQLFGYEKKELQQTTVYQLMANAAEKSLLQNFMDNEGEVNDLEITLQTKNGEKKTCIFSATATVDEGQELFQGLLHDVTTMRRAEKANLQMEKLGATGRLVRTLAHEVRNPLNNINMSVEQLIQSSPEEDEAHLFLDIVQRNSIRIGNIITELLDTSRPTDLVFEENNLLEIMEEALADAIDRITLQQVSLNKNYAAEPSIIMANNEKLKIAFLNIVINAVEALPTGTGQLHISIEPVKEGHAVVIKDNGCGIPEENISRLFEPYFTSKRNGMGLGLAATLNILQSHKANIDVTSAVGKGTTFTITFPKV